GANLGPKLSGLVVEPPVLQGVADDALDVETRFAEWNCFLPLVDFQWQSCAPLHQAIGTRIVSGGNVFDAPVLIDLIAQVSSPKLNIQTRLEQRFHGDRAIDAILFSG